MVAKQDLKFLKHLLSSIYDPANDSPPKFIQNYNQLLHHRDSLDQQYHDKERKRAAMKRAEAPTPAPKLHGSRFSELPDNDEGSTVSPNLEPKISADIETNQLDKLTANERKQVVATLQREIQELQQQKKTQREARKGKNGRKEDRDEANNEDQDETGELEQEQDWETVNRSGKR